MAKFALDGEFEAMHSNISIGDRALIAIAAHVEVRAVLRDSQELRRHGLDDVLIGSYARKVSNWPGKDVDVFGRLMGESVNSIAPDIAYEMFGRALQRFDAEGRLTPQPRSYKVEYRPDRYPDATFIRTAAQEYKWRTATVNRVLSAIDRLGFEFSVDVVPAVVWGDHYGIPEIGRMQRTGQRYRTGSWRETDPVALTEATKLRNRSPLVAGKGAFVRTVKTIKQIKSAHLQGAKPSALYYEFLLHDGFASGDIKGETWADMTSSALSYLADRLRGAEANPACDPVLAEPYAPAPTPADLQSCRSIFDDLASRARRAVTSNGLCEAAKEWRYILGGNGRLQQVFPLPAGCRETGAAMGLAAVNVATGGTEEKSFGGR